MGPWNLFKLLLAIVSVFSFVPVFGKLCTNVLPSLNSHDLQSELSKHDFHLTPTDDSAWSTLNPDDFNWNLFYRFMKNSDGSEKHRPGNFLKEIPLDYVRLDPESMHGKAQQTNLEYLLMLDVDNLVWSFRNTSGLPAPGTPYGGWEKPDCELRGHFVGHFLSASARMWASTKNETLRQRMTAVVSALNECQQKMGTGYLSAFPTELFDRIESLIPAWAPYYTIHKIMAGLLDQHLVAGNPQALPMVIKMADYFSYRVQNVIMKFSLERHWASLNEESGGMNDVYYKLYDITGNQKYLILAHLFDKPCFLGQLALQEDSISGFHTNTHIPIVIGVQSGYEVTGDPLFKAMGTFFLDIVNSSHTYATGGTSVREFWTDPGRLADTLQSQNEESCTTYNMLKVSRNLFRWTKETAYADYYERALTNGVLSIQRGREPGIMIYFLPLERGASKARSVHSWGTQFDTFWCCYGTAIESFSKLGDTIYFEEEGVSPQLYVIQSISSSLDWQSGQIELQQIVDPVVSWDPFLHVKLAISAKGGKGISSTLNLRIPHWSNSNGTKATLDGQDLLIPAAGNFLSVTRNWKTGNELILELPISLRAERIQDDRLEYASVQALHYGPYLLAGLSSGDWDLKKGKDSSSFDWVTAIPATYNSHLVSFTQGSSNGTLVLTNLNNSITMQEFPKPGMDSEVHATFRLVSKDGSYVNFSSPIDAVGKSFMLEPFDLPGSVVALQGLHDSLAVTNVSGSGYISDTGSSVFKVIAGLDGNNDTISLELEGQQGCLVHTEVNDNAETGIKLSCQSKNGSTDAAFQQVASFTLTKGFSEYHPISFVAKGVSRNFLLMPLLSLRDESYTVYFNITA